MSNQIEDFQDDFKLVEPAATNRKADRYIWFGGNALSDMETQHPDCRLGGENFGSDFPALSISKGYLHRARITPITEKAIPYSKHEETQKEVEVYGEELRLADGGDRERIVHVKRFPGDQLNTIVFGSRTGAGKGVVELTALKGLKWADEKERRFVQALQLKFFPNWTEILRGEEALPETLREIENLIRTAQDKYSKDTVVVQSAKEMLVGCNQFRTWGKQYLDREAVRIRAGQNPNGGYVHSYSDVAEVLLRQLEIKRESLVDNARPEPIVIRESTNPELTQLLQRQQEMMEQNQQLIQAILGGQAVQSATQPAAK